LYLYLSSVNDSSYVVGLPFSYFWGAIPANPTAQQLHALYMTLHARAVQSVGEYSYISAAGSSSPISYNLGITDRGMVICPRTSEGLIIETSKGDPIGPIALNGTLLAGTLLVKSEVEWDTLRNDESKLKDILGSIGITTDNNAARI